MAPPPLLQTGQDGDRVAPVNRERSSVFPEQQVGQGEFLLHRVFAEKNLPQRGVIQMPEPKRLHGVEFLNHEGLLDKESLSVISKNQV